MAYLSTIGCGKGLSSSRPPLFDGTNFDIKDSRMETLIKDYENFNLLEGETIIDMETRFTRIIDELSQLGKVLQQTRKNEGF